MREQNKHDHVLASQQAASAKFQEVSGTADSPAIEEQLQQTERKIEERMSAFERSMLRLTRAGVFIAVLTALIFGGQLYEMRKGGSDTHDLAAAAKAQAEAAIRQLPE